jgi:hypothetical protein
LESYNESPYISVNCNGGGGEQKDEWLTIEVRSAMEFRSAGVDSNSLFEPANHFTSASDPPTSHITLNWMTSLSKEI